MQHGYLHRDISIGNILKLKTKAHRKPFAILDPFPNDYDISGLSLDDQQPHQPSTVENEKADMQALNNVFAVEKERLEVLLRSLDVTTECTAILSDFDLAQPLHQSSQDIGAILVSVYFKNPKACSNFVIGHAGVHVVFSPRRDQNGR